MLRIVSVENSNGFGVQVERTKRNTMKNCNVSHSKGSGLNVGYEGLMTIDGNGTTIHHNCTHISLRPISYGLKAYDSYSSIHLSSSLTKERISTDNEADRDYGGRGTIKSVDKNGKVLEVVFDGSADDVVVDYSAYARR